MSRTLAGIDWRQWRVLVPALLKHDLRGANTSLGFATRTPHGGLRTVLLTYGLLGGGLSSAMWWSADSFVAASLQYSYVTLIAASAVVLDFAVLVLSPDDLERVAHLPVSERTYIAAKLSAVTAYTMLMVGALTALPTLVWLTRDGIGQALLAAALSALAAAGAVGWSITGYLAVLRWASPMQLRRLLTIVQLLLIFVVYASFLLVPLAFAGRMTTLLAREDISPWIWLVPGTWFAAWLDPAGAARLDAPASIRLVSAFVVLSVPIVVTRLLALDVSPRLVRPAGRTGDGPHGLRMLRGAWRRDEGRAVALLVGAQFRHDWRFRLAVLSILPLTLVYFLAGSIGEEAGAHRSILYYAPLGFPSILYQALVRSESFRAAWIYHATPADPVRLLAALSRLVQVGFLAPYLLFLGCLLLPSTGDPLLLVWRLLIIALAGRLMLSVQIAIAPRLPFSEPPGAVQRSGQLTLTVALVTFVAVLAMTVLEWTASDWHVALAAIALLAAVDRLVSVWGRRRTEARRHLVEFAA